MALVSYDYSSGSEQEDEVEENITSSVVVPVTQKPEPQQTDNTFTKEESSDISRLLSDLPKTKSSDDKKVIVEDKLEDFIPKYEPAKEKRPQKVKITIPSLSQFADIDDEEPLHKKLKTAAKGSGLLSLLPPVKGSPLSTKSFVPKVVEKKMATSASQKTNSLVPNAVRKKAELAKMAAIKKVTKASTSSSDVESDDDTELPETFDDEMWKKVCGRPTVKEVVPVIEETVSTPAFNIAPEPVKPYDGLDNQAFKELIGKSKRPVNVKLIDINEEEILPDKDLWMTKSLTDPDQEPKPVVENPVDPTRKKKHHITYLAEQAKAKEQEFKSQWAASKHTRNQTRAKYGF